MSQARDKKLAREQRKRLDTIHARKLASVDYYYSLDPDRAATLASIDPSMANKLRKHPAYAEQMESLDLQMTAKLSAKMDKESDKIRARFSDLVPEAIERLASQVTREDVLGLQAAREILDRDGRMPKVSRVQTTVENKTGLQDVDAAVLDEFKVSPKQVN